MSLAHLQITNLRNLKTLQLNLHPKLNIILGENGSGKTSLLESLYLLSSGQSFRTREIAPLVRDEASQLTVFARTLDGQTISLQKSKEAAIATQFKLNDTFCKSRSELAKFLPCQVFYQAIFQIMDAGPAVRRSLLDWGLFHKDQAYHTLFKDYKRLLKQRNALLKQRALPSYLLPWDKGLSEHSCALHEARKSYLAELLPIFYDVLEKLTVVKCTISYDKGWDTEATSEALLKLLQSNYAQDVARQTTYYGAHQADLRIEASQRLAKRYLSRGQQKIVLFALKLAQSRLIEKPCLYLCDDISTELDEYHLNSLGKLIDDSVGQFFITSIQASALPANWRDIPPVYLSEGELVCGVS